jgi:hypothetical protein
MLKAALIATMLSAMTLTAAWALPGSPASKPADASPSNVIPVGKWDGKGHHGKGHWKHGGGHWKHGKGHWKGWHHRGRYWRHRYHYRPRNYWGCVQVGPFWYCDF